MGQFSDRKGADGLRIVRILTVGYKRELSRRFESSPEGGHRSPAPPSGFHRTVLQYVLGLPVASFPIADVAAGDPPVLLSTGSVVPRCTAVPWHPVPIPECGGGQNSLPWCI